MVRSAVTLLPTKHWRTSVKTVPVTKFFFFDVLQVLPEILDHLFLPFPQEIHESPKGSQGKQNSHLKEIHQPPDHVMIPEAWLTSSPSSPSTPSSPCSPWGTTGVHSGQRRAHATCLMGSREIEWDWEDNYSTLLPENPLVPCKRRNLSHWHIKDSSWVHRLLEQAAAASLKKRLCLIASGSLCTNGW